MIIAIGLLIGLRARAAAYALALALVLNHLMTCWLESSLGPATCNATPRYVEADQSALTEIRPFLPASASATATCMLKHVLQIPAIECASDRPAQSLND